MEAADVAPINNEEYLQGELESDVRHEFYDGYVYAMAGFGSIPYWKKRMRYCN